MSGRTPDEQIAWEEFVEFSSRFLPLHLGWSHEQTRCWVVEIEREWTAAVQTGQTSWGWFFHDAPLEHMLPLLLAPQVWEQLSPSERHELCCRLAQEFYRLTDGEKIPLRRDFDFRELSQMIRRVVASLGYRAA